MTKRWSTRTPTKGPTDGSRHDSAAGDRTLYGPPVGVGLSGEPGFYRYQKRLPAGQSLDRPVFIVDVALWHNHDCICIGRFNRRGIQGRDRCLRDAGRVKIYGFGRKYGYTTQIQFFRDRLESNFVGVLLFPILVCLIIPYLLIGVMASGTVIQTMTSGAFANEGIFFFGGMRGTAWANTFQTLVFMVLGLVTFVLIANKLGGGESLLESLRNVTAKVDDHHVTRTSMSKTKFFTYMFIPLSVGMFPHLFQHWLTARSVNSFKLSVVCHPIFIMIVWVPCVLLGIWATTDGALPTAVMAKIKPNAVLPALVKFHTTALVGGLLTAGILAAVMSSLDSQFLCLGSMFTNDIVDHYAGKGRIGDKTQICCSLLP